MRGKGWGAVGAIAALLAAGPARATSEASETGFQFLGLGVGARSEALAAGTVLAEGSEALAWNPARLARLAGPTFSASWYSWMLDTQAGHVAGAVPFRRGALGFTSTSLSVGDIRNVTEDPAVGESDLAVSVGGAYPVIGGLDGGAAFRYVRSSLAGTDATGWACDAGLDYRYVEGWNAAVAVRNFGPAMSYGNGPEEQLPTQTALGAAGTFGELRLGAEGFWENGPGWRGLFGAEYGIKDRLSLRAGTRLGEKKSTAVDPWSVGLGLLVRRGLELDYSFRNGTFDASHRLGVSWTLDRSRGTGGEKLARSPREYYLSVLNEVIDQAMVDFPREVKGRILVRPKSEHPAGSLIAETLASRLNDLGLTAEARGVVQTPPSTGDATKDEKVRQSMEAAGVLADPTLPALTFDIRESAYSLLRESRERWIGPRSVEREARVSLDFTLTEPGQENPVWSFQGSGKQSEEVAMHSIPTSAGYPKAGGTGAEANRSLNPYFEPMIVGGIVTGLAVIFFSNRNVGK
jgi:hypothetical protein